LPPQPGRHAAESGVLRGAGAHVLGACGPGLRLVPRERLAPVLTDSSGTWYLLRRYGVQATPPGNVLTTARSSWCAANRTSCAHHFKDTSLHAPPSFRSVAAKLTPWRSVRPDELSYS